jgi:hypothetical protein
VGIGDLSGTIHDFYSDNFIGIGGFEANKETHKYVRLNLENVTYDQYTKAIHDTNEEFR